MMTRKSVWKIAVSSLIMGASLASCASGSQSARPQSLTAKAEKALEKGDTLDAIARAEEAVRVGPREVAARSVLAQSYLAAGRFMSAEKTFEDALELGDTSARTVISLALAYVANDKSVTARNLLADHRDAIPASDYGLAMALAGDVKQGVRLLEDLVRNGVNSPKVRQNLAYSYALDGRWSEAKLLASQDVSPEQANARILEWARTARPDLAQMRVAALLGVKAYQADDGQPAQLALAPQTENEMAVALTDTVMQAEAKAEAEKLEKAPEKPEFEAESAPSVAVPQAPVQLAAAAPVPLIAAPEKPIRVKQVESIEIPAAKPAKATPAPKAVAKPAPARAAFRAANSGSVREGSYIVQLGAFSSQANAERAWSVFSGKYRELRGFDHVRTPVTSRGRKLHRVSAAGLGNRQSAIAMCNGIKASGGSCIVRKAGKSIAGTRFASR
ncbi:SPOR domain-containing protein [Alterisphingorhabdus coralli]|uniref:SPOR domain-containing protein n=1 Tax=Alterisphingorhabdus coralli TaxID=3071408 RepID=A0AA97HZ76_9SPHN|nr:SPOR domain-containing protein [Parasphingorhabdus sp. SCSIO 66989]WOE74299.1 SPOR domain-containing protein [Parasphingorhabdus sp. SCSIO 66989]